MKDELGGQIMGEFVGKHIAIQKTIIMKIKKQKEQKTV